MGLTYGPLGTVLSELFPTSVRYTGSSLTFNFAGIFGASLAPYIATGLAKNYGLQFVGYYLFGAAVLTLIGGGVFGNPIPLIWDAIRWATAETEPLLSRDLDVIVNGRNLGGHVPRETILAGVRERGGALLAFPRTGPPEVVQ